jgi:hypothetical protein
VQEQSIRDVVKGVRPDELVPRRQSRRIMDVVRVRAELAVPVPVQPRPQIGHVAFRLDDPRRLLR